MSSKLSENELKNIVQELHKQHSCDYFEYDVDSNEISIRPEILGLLDAAIDIDSKWALEDFVKETYGWVLTDKTSAVYDTDRYEELKSRNI